MASISDHVVLCILLTSVYSWTASSRSFQIDYEKNVFVRDGQPFRYIAGAMHYFRVPREYWKDRMLKMRAAGLNTIQTYIAWNMHEPQQGQFDFTGRNDFEAFVKLAQEFGFLCVLRSGPYMDAERDMGGFPYWLLSNNPHMQLRTSDPSYLKYVDHWLSVLLPKVKPLLYENGGPIISVQVENEYGSYYACDFKYMHHLRDLYRKYLGPTVILFTTDGDSDGYLRCGKVSGLYSTVDFGAGTNVTAAFAAQRRHEPHGPLVNSEFYPGWIDHWGEPHSVVSSSVVAKTLHQILSVNASVDIYMFEGGTSYGFENGANLGDTFTPSPTSYDFDAPLSEAGDPTEKYFKLRQIISEFHTLPPGPVPPATPKFAYGQVMMKRLTTLFSYIPQLCPHGPVRSKYPLTFEQVRQDYGFILYRTNITMNFSTSILTSETVHDRAYVFVDKKPVGILDRQTKRYGMFMEKVHEGQILDVIVENQGRVCYGSFINDSKGLVSNLTLNGNILTDWEIFSLPLNKSQPLPSHVHYVNESRNDYEQVPAFYHGTFKVPPALKSPRDTYLNMFGWFHGVVFINGFNLGRYWPVKGPQITLFLPAPILRMPPETNDVIMLELEFAPCSQHFSSDRCSIELTTQPILNGTISTSIYD